ncbi:MAG TPA: hypothetical protein VGR21_05955, partial [Cryptosporangiaceae bacterium]|nr:hypothetical protein [Cryptosporangiaceae bacterium]
AAWQARRREQEREPEETDGRPVLRRPNVPRVAQGVIAALVLVALVVGGLLAGPWIRERTTAQRAPLPTPSAAVSLPSQPGQSLPPTVDPAGSPIGRPADSLRAWAGEHEALGIPVVALQAYGYAQAVIAQVQPSCHLSWTVLAGIGRVESDHGRYRGATLNPDGTSTPRIIGATIEGITPKVVADTDRGALDGDATSDRPVGPMQLSPATWKTWAVDADRDGKSDPFDIDDASMATAYYLCAGGHDLGTGKGWWNAVLSYKDQPPYAARVYSESDRYGRQSRTL